MDEKIYALIPKVMADIGAVSKERSNEQQKYKFRGIEDFYQAAHPALIKHGVFCAPEVLEREEYRFEKTNYEGKATTWLHVTMKVRHRFYAEDGSYVDVITCGEGLDNSDKASNKAMSGAMKYAMIELFCVPTKDVEDSDRETPEQGAKRNTSTETIVIERPPVKVPAPAAVTTGSGITIKETQALNDIQDKALAAHAADFKKAAVKQVTIPPDDPFAEPFITSEQAGKIAKRFRESLREELQPMAEELRHNALTYYKYIDEHGNPSSLMIKAKDFTTMGKKLIEYARGL